MAVNAYRTCLRAEITVLYKNANRIYLRMGEKIVVAEHADICCLRTEKHMEADNADKSYLKTEKYLVA